MSINLEQERRDAVATRARGAVAEAIDSTGNELLASPRHLFHILIFCDGDPPSGIVRRTHCDQTTS